MSTRLRYNIVQVCGIQHRVVLAGLQALCLPEDTALPTSKGWWWLATDPDGAAAGFASMSMDGMKVVKIGFLDRSGVLQEDRGNGLQRLLIAAREKLARAQGFKALVSTTYCNPQSGNNLMGMGFTLYTPQEPWGAEGTNYWRKELV